MDGCGQHSLLSRIPRHLDDACEVLLQWRMPHSAFDPLRPQEGRDHVT